MDVLASRGIGPLDVKIAFALGSLFVDSVAQFVHFELFVVVSVGPVSISVVSVVVIVVLVFVDLLTGKTFTRLNNWFRGERQLDTVVSLGIGTTVSTSRASLVVKDSKVDGLAILLGTVRSNEVLSVPAEKVGRVKIYRVANDSD